MEKKNDPKEAFRKITIEMTGEAEVLVINPRLYARTVKAAIAYRELYEDDLKGWASPVSTLSEEERIERLITLSRFLNDLLLELGDGVDLCLLPTSPNAPKPSSDVSYTAE